MKPGYISLFAGITRSPYQVFSTTSGHEFQYGVHVLFTAAGRRDRTDVAILRTDYSKYVQLAPV
jgi:hypothetical protein